MMITVVKCILCVNIQNVFVGTWRKTEKRLRVLDGEIEDMYKGWRPAKRRRKSKYRSHYKN